MAVPGAPYTGADAGEGLLARANPARQSKLSYGQELRAQMEADNARRQQQQRATPPADAPAVGIIPGGRPANPGNNRMPVIRGATPPPGGRGPVRGERRPKSGRRANADAQGEQKGSRSPQLRGLGGGEEQPPRFGPVEGGAGQKVLEQEVQHLTHQVQELLEIGRAHV